ncbi:antibiotic biosynthesis monooxygenase [Zobellella endophytica]|uniref:Antibiotic biosynthesis monooxygenase n=1 Tax=Zobellella endophytica TaxID=2116700 RepID=A0A2P7R0R4_9GAMM|nr:antibiotic biosynthesis monooxygenase [Zobellella endophytica]PSJ43799.1 antibiotic biosynthesis monooxygenase [Zobellella endophytica]
MTEQPSLPAGGVSVLIRHRIRQEAMSDYEHWLRKTIDVAAGFAGHQGVNILKPAGGHTQYDIAVRFASRAEAEAWVHSRERRALLEEAEGYLVLPDEVDIATGIDNWFQPLNPPVKQPTRWKQWLLTTLVIWLLTLLVPPALSLLLFEPVPLLGLWGLRHAITAAAIVALVIYVIMPRLVRRVSGWLFR